jgi:hypothetical protein
LRRRGGAFPITLIGAAILIAACVDIPTGSNDILSLQFNPLPSPSVVVGDSLRDTLGVVQPLKVTAFNFSGAEVANVPVTFHTLDKGIHVDSLTGIVTGDSVRTGARIIASVRGLDVTVPITVSYKPDSISTVNGRDSLEYAVLDTLNISRPIGITLLNSTAKVDSARAVQSYIVSFRVVSPGDTALAKLVTENGRRSSVDTTDASGVAARSIRLDVKHLTAAVDSIIVQAFVRYKGINVRGSPARLVLKVKPK